MNRLTKLMAPLAIALALGLSQTPAKAQGNLAGVFGGGGGGDGDMMTQMEPMLEMLKKKMGKKRFTQLMQTVGPMFAGGEGGGGFGGFGGGGFGGGGFDFNNIGGSFGGGGFGGGGFDMSAVSGLMSSGMIQQIGSFGGRKGKRSRRH